MRSFRVGIVLGASAVGLVFAFGAESCASPTTITVDVRADESICTGAIKQTGIAVTTWEQVADAPLTIFEEGCHAPSSVGTLVISPSGANDAHVGIRVVAGIGKTAEACAISPDNCIVATRKIRFSPGKNVPLTVYLEPSCVSITCKSPQSCVDGACVDPTIIENDGGITPDAPNPPDPPPDASAPDTGMPPADSGADTGPFDAGDPCDFCKGNGTTCDGKNCTVDCTIATVKCKAPEPLCGPGLDCTIKCGAGNACTNTTCGNGGTSCNFDCNGGTKDNRCPAIACDAGTCKATCSSVADQCAKITFAGGDNLVTCLPTPGADGPDASCNNVSCKGAKCTRTCGLDSKGCGEASNCSGNCTAWELSDGGKGP